MTEPTATPPAKSQEQIIREVVSRDHLGYALAVIDHHRRFAKQSDEMTDELICAHRTLRTYCEWKKGERLTTAEEKKELDTIVTQSAVAEKVIRKNAKGGVHEMLSSGKDPHILPEFAQNATSWKYERELNAEGCGDGYIEGGFGRGTDGISTDVTVIGAMKDVLKPRKIGDPYNGVGKSDDAGVVQPPKVDDGGGLVRPPKSPAPEDMDMSAVTGDEAVTPPPGLPPTPASRHPHRGRK